MSYDTPNKPAADPSNGPGEPGVGPDPSRDFPAVSPPSSSFFVQLFLLPALIVFGIMTVWFLFGKIAGTHQSPEEYLAILKSERKDRWKAAMDLSYLLQEGSKYRKDQGLALELSEALQQGLMQPNVDPKYLEYLAGAVSSFELPTGVPALRQAAQPNQPLPVRRAALIGLANLAHRIGDLQDPNVVLEVREHLRDEEVEIREIAAVTLGQVGSSQAVPALEAALHDPVPTVRYNVAIALGTLGSDAAMNTYPEMLDTEGLANQFRIKDPTGKEYQDQQLVIGTVLSTLRALQNLEEQAPETNFEPVLASVQNLLNNTESANVRQQARELLIQIGQSPAGQ